MGSFFNSGSGPFKVDTDEDKENGWIKSWVKKQPHKPSFWSRRRHGCSSGWCMCGCGPHFSNQLCIACLSGSVRWQSEQWWDDFSERYTGFVERWHATERNATRERGQKKKGENHVWSHSVTGARCCSCSTFLSSAEKTHSDPDNLRSWVRRQTLACCVKVCVARECQNWVTLPLKIGTTAFCCWAETELDVQLFFLSPQN